jgi:hypothetical protein
VAFCLEKQDRLLEAQRAYQGAGDLLEKQPAPDVKELIPEAIERVRAALPHVVIHGLRERSRVFVDGKPLKSRDAAFVDPGRHQVSVETPGYEVYRDTLEAVRGRTVLVQVKLVALKAPAPVVSAPPAPSAPRKSRAQRVVLWSGIGLGTAGLATGIVGTLSLVSANSKVKDANAQIDSQAPGQSSPCFDPSGGLAQACEDLRDAQNQKDIARVLTIAGYSAAGVGLVGAIVAQYFWRKRSARGAGAAGRGGAAWRVEGAALRGGGFLSVRGAF